MVVQYCSDLHLEFRENKQFLNRYPLQPKGEILLLAGDIILFSEIDKVKDFFDYISDTFELTYWVPGNHEYYYSDASQRSDSINEKIRENVFLVNNISIRHQQAKLIFSTLWSRISPVNEWQVERSISDFQVIKFNGNFFSAADFNQLHSNSLGFLKKELSNNNGENIIVVTHHVPTLINYPSKFKDSVLNDAFAVELSPFIETSGINHWIYGHHHFNVADFTIGNTVLHTNQLGYVRIGEHKHFIQAKTITV